MKIFRFLAIGLAIATLISGAITIGTSVAEAGPDWCGAYDCANHHQCGKICKSDFTGEMIWLLGPLPCPGQEGVHWCAE